jgi:hypothetical protein
VGLDAVLELFPGDKRTDNFKAALGGLGVSDMATLADAVVKGSGAVAEVLTITGRATELQTRLDGAVTVPGENATTEVISAFKSKIGVPTTISEYGLSKLEAEDSGKEFLNAFLKAGVRKNVATVLVNELNALDTGRRQQIATDQAAAYQKAVAALGEGAETMINKGLEVLFPGDENLALRESKSKDPDLVGAWHSVGRVSMENPRQFTNVDRGQLTKSPYPSMDARNIK